MKKDNMDVEILSPGGDIHSIKSAIAANANAIYCGLKSFNARKRAENLYYEQLEEITLLAHQYNCKIYLTLNTIIFENEIDIIKEILFKISKLGIDGIIVQDWGVFLLLKELFPSIPIHASTQTTTHNKGQIEFLANLKVRQVNLCRELSLDEIKELCNVSKKLNIKPEVFVHGALCISFSGQCYMSKVLYNRSGNRGECIQPCRMSYLCKETNKKGLFLNLKDLSAFKRLQSLIEAGVKTFKIEGRLRNRDYVYIVTQCYSKELERILKNRSLDLDENLLYKVFNRGFTCGYLDSKISNEMFSDSSADKSLSLLGRVIRFNAKDSIIEISQKGEIPYNTPIRIYSKGFTFICTADIKERIGEKSYYLQITNKLKGKINPGDYIYKKSLLELDKEIEEKINKLQITKKKIAIFVEGKEETPLKITFVTATRNIELTSSTKLTKAEKHPLTKEIIEEKLRLVNHPLFEISSIDCSGLAENLFLPLHEIKNIKHLALEKLSKSSNISEESINISLEKTFNNIPLVNFSLCYLVDSLDDLNIPLSQSSRFVLELPPSLENNLDKYTKLLNEKRDVIPYFTSILIGKHFDISKKLLEEVKPPLIITDNIGIGWEAAKNGISWIAGVLLNVSNSLSVKCLMKYGGCGGAFFSSELSLQEIKKIPVPKGFLKGYSYSPLSFLMSTRQCIIRRCINCKKEIIEEECFNYCNKKILLQLQNKNIYTIKRKGFYTQLYLKKPFFFNKISFPKKLPYEIYMIDLRWRNLFTSEEPSVENIISSVESAFHK